MQVNCDEMPLEPLLPLKDASPADFFITLLAEFYIVESFEINMLFFKKKFILLALNTHYTLNMSLFNN